MCGECVSGWSGGWSGELVLVVGGWLLLLVVGRLVGSNRLELAGGWCVMDRW